ncbi:MAG: hypothetical protein QOH06_5207 [Acidobacteriota bacterium]|jgi:ribosomal protein RSM22 (predicted rRNA methylase)|nr:hypothetical protein [Acidobacteriota bacterium]
MLMANKKPPSREPEEERSQISVRILAVHRERLKALATVKSQNEYALVDEALEVYWNWLPEQDRKDAETLAEITHRRQAKNQDTSRP